jgi:Flp pilus assembly protein TadD
LLCAALLSRDGKPGLAAALLERELPPPHSTVLDGDVLLYGALVQLYVSVGDLEEAARTTEAIERCCASAAGPSAAMRRAQVHICQGLIAVGQGKFGDAVDCFHAALQVEPSNVVAANNRAVCMLYMCALPHALLALEQSLASGHMNQVVIGNLCTLYDLASDKSSDKKKQLLGLVSKYASDDFITQELAPKLSAASGTTSVSKPTETPPAAAASATAGAAQGGALAKRSSISSPAAVSKAQKKAGATTKL